MAEGGPTIERPATNVLKTARAQKEDAARHVADRGFLERLAGKTYSSSHAEYNEGRGGRVETRLKYGKARINKSFTFDEKGDLSSVHVLKQMEGRYSPALVIQLKKDEASGYFKIMKHETGFSLPDWEKEFKEVVKPAPKKPGLGQPTETRLNLGK